MKSILIMTVIASTMALACNNNNSTSKVEKTMDTVSTPSTIAVQNQSPFNEVIETYLAMKNALADDNGNEASVAAHRLGEAIQKTDTASLDSGQLKMFYDVRDDIKEHAEHIGANGGNIEHQREHFDMLSPDIYDLVKTGKPDRTLYKEFCPMYHNNKGAYWLSETREIKNPYLGKKMGTCGEVKEEIK